MDRFLAWWRTSSEGLNWNWLEHIALLLAAAAFSWLVWKVVFGKLVSVSKTTKTQWDTIVLESVSVPISVLIWLWPSSYAIDSLLEVTSKASANWFAVSRRVMLFGVVLWILLRLVNRLKPT
ncbi:hypothetical protein P4S70_03235 [Enterovibrio sp. Hal110]